MSKGIIYVMTTVVPGLIKIGKTKSENYEQRMYNLEHNGYSNVVGLKRQFAIEVEDYDEKELLLDDIFSKSRLENTELFALDINLVIQLLSSFEGRQIYPKDTSKTDVFESASRQEAVGETPMISTDAAVPNGTYFMKQKIKAWGGKEVNATMEVKNSAYVVKRGSVVCPIRSNSLSVKQVDTKRKTATIVDNILQEDVEFNSPSLAGVFVLFANCNGWTTWKTQDGRFIDCFRRE